MFSRSIPEIDVIALAEILKSDEDFILIDVREPWELERAKLDSAHVTNVPLSQLSAQGTAALPEAAQSPEGRVYIMCHHGSRSTQVTAWLVKQGWKNVFNIRGGIDAYAHEVDKSVGMY
jgi:rhodanese-related sulfurtransferase